jgi:two-component system response regulator MprA
MDAKPRVLVVDDDSRIAASVKRALVYEGYLVEVAHDGRGALASALAREPDLVVLDIMLPDIDGMEVCRRLRRVSDVPILMLTARDATPDRVAGLDTGADDYLVKPFAHEELLARVRALLRRRAPAANRVLKFADLVMDVAEHAVRRTGRKVDLTAQEFDLLHYFLLHPRQVYQMEEAGKPGPAFAGPVAQWHSHNICVTVLPPAFSLVSPFGSCPLASVDVTLPQMIHVWTIDNPGGPYAQDLSDSYVRKVMTGRAP